MLSVVISNVVIMNVVMLSVLGTRGIGAFVEQLTKDGKVVGLNLVSFREKCRKSGCQPGANVTKLFLSVIYELL